MKSVKSVSPILVSPANCMYSRSKTRLQLWIPLAASRNDIGVRWGQINRASLIPRPSHHPVFDCLQYVNMEGTIYHVSDVNVYLGKHRGRDPRPWKCSWSLIAVSIQALVSWILHWSVAACCLVQRMHALNSFRIPQVIKNWTVGRPKNKAVYELLFPFLTFCETD